MNLHARKLVQAIFSLIVALAVSLSILLRVCNWKENDTKYCTNVKL